ncbi:MAG: hypothetical protein QNJ70_17710 [Xenococcaceae cyanobacterium MO_207.B15]|nr:hypothetical protein [Xenococcaceae cyanobacterium MO_207.B15]
MCFSASASFTVSTILIPTGIYCLREARKKDETYIPVASWPLFFGMQQGFEGLVWSNIISENTIAVTNFALCFLFFSHFFWLFWIPFSAFSLEDNQLLKSLLKIFTITGFIYGSMLYFPLLINDNWLQIEVFKNSINYVTYFFFNTITPHNFSFYLYALIITLPLIISSRKTINFLGILIILGALITYFGFHYALISVWCFLAAIVSIYLAYIVNNIPCIDSSQI